MRRPADSWSNAALPRKSPQARAGRSAFTRQSARDHVALRLSLAWKRHPCRLNDGMLMTPRPHIATLTLAALTLMLAAACATTNTPAPPDERLLTEAGFKTIPASTQQQQQHLQTL